MNRSSSLWIVFIILSFMTTAVADVSMPGIFSDNMVLQRDMEIPVWGWTDANDTVRVIARDQSVETKADAAGKWQVKLKPMSVGKPFELKIVGSHNEVVFKNVVMGEVWICSGQSNMEWTVNGSGNPEQERLNAKHPMIRHIKIVHKVSTKPEADAKTFGWQVCSPETAGNFTAVGYYFGRHLHKELNVPIGLINTTWGGTIVEAWTSGRSLETHADFKDRIAEVRSGEKNREEETKKFREDMKVWQAKYDAALKASLSEGLEEETTNWKDINAPGQWESQGYTSLDGIAWYRRTIKIPSDWIGKDLSLSLAKIDDRDQTYVNGKLVGSMRRHMRNRVYAIAGSLVDDDSVDIAVQVHDTGGAGGIYGRPAEMSLKLESAEPVSLAGKWKFKPSAALSAMPPRPKAPGFNGPNNPMALFNGMVNPLVPVAFRGAIWYQGESNVGRARQYQSLFPLLIEDWRKEWKRDFPFYWVQLANFMAPAADPVESGWAELREAQSMTLKTPETGQAVIIDIGDARDIHPKNKQDVGKRLGLIALNQTYGKKNVAYSGPVYQSMSVEGNKARLSFAHSKGLKSSNAGELKYFSIAGADKKFVWAKAIVENDQVVVWADGVENPTAVRYAWADNPAGCNLTNESGLPASPFRTDSK